MAANTLAASDLERGSIVEVYDPATGITEEARVLAKYTRRPLDPRWNTAEEANQSDLGTQVMVRFDGGGGGWVPISTLRAATRLRGQSQLRPGQLRAIDNPPMLLAGAVAATRNMSPELLAAVNKQNTTVLMAPPKRHLKPGPIKIDGMVAESREWLVCSRTILYSATVHDDPAVFCVVGGHESANVVAH